MRPLESTSLQHINTLNRPLSHWVFSQIASGALTELPAYLLLELTVSIHIYPPAKTFLSFQAITRINFYIHKQNLKFHQCPQCRHLVSQLKPASPLRKLGENRNFVLSQIEFL